MLRPLIDSTAISTRVGFLGRQITQHYAGKDLLVVPLLGGAFCFVADLVRHIHHPELQLHFSGASSYVGTESTGQVQLRDIPHVTNRHVLIVDDILDTGRTMTRVAEAMTEGGAADIKSCVLLDKPARRVTDATAEFVGFTIPDHFVVGYGLDFNERYRHLPDICVLPPELRNSD